MNILLNLAYAIKRIFNLGPRAVNMLQAQLHLNPALEINRAQDTRFFCIFKLQCIVLFCD